MGFSSYCTSEKGKSNWIYKCNNRPKSAHGSSRIAVSNRCDPASLLRVRARVAMPVYSKDIKDKGDAILDQDVESVPIGQIAWEFLDLLESEKLSYTLVLHTDLLLVHLEILRCIHTCMYHSLFVLKTLLNSG